GAPNEGTPNEGTPNEGVVNKLNVDVLLPNTGGTGSLFITSPKN
ncbi:1481_t:CDS:1, partial [Rhizophagus irregularis]